MPSRLNSVNMVICESKKESKVETVWVVVPSLTFTFTFTFSFQLNLDSSIESLYPWNLLLQDWPGSIERSLLEEVDWKSLKKALLSFMRSLKQTESFLLPNLRSCLSIVLQK